ncbi:hypothetical protein F511_07880 [Dorcoceras hygrometricum]|uniref:Uncharacterized protein n=1 Tax=Dorcoceras hygrometricum TaxID=472368 RepID=A0A2Z7CK21_9LAMI|nr:hypothetical protein F511_07880 [Dorcoceras hygrometricum]
MSYQLIQTTSFAMHPRLVEYNAVALDWMYCSCLLVNIICWILVFALLLNPSLQEPSAESYEGKTLSYQLMQKPSFCNRQIQTPTTGCTATGYFLYDVASSLALLFTTADSFLLIVMSLLMTSSMLSAPAAFFIC